MKTDIVMHFRRRAVCLGAVVCAAAIWGMSASAGDAAVTKKADVPAKSSEGPPPELKPLSGNPSVDVSAAEFPEPAGAGKAEGEPAHGEKGDSEADESNELNPALANDAGALATTNLRDPHAVKKAKDQIQEYETQLAMARRMRMEHNPQDAEKLLTSLLQSAAPERLKKTALLEMAFTAQQSNQFARAQQMLAQYVQRYPNDFNVPEVLLRQGLLFRRMGAPNQALSKFYAVMGTSLNLKAEHFKHYQRLVLQAQAEVADTYFLQGRFDEAIEKYMTVLKEQAPELNRSEIQYKLIRCYAALNKSMELVTQSELFLREYPEEGGSAEVRFLLASALKQLNRPAESLKQVLLLLQAKSQTFQQATNDWVYWQQKTGNEIANQLYKEGNYTDALAIYKAMVEMDETPRWRLPVEYQTGLVYERLGQPEKATEMYERIVSADPAAMTNATPGLKAVVEMAKWRKDFLKWNMGAEKEGLKYKSNRANAPDAP